MPSQPTTDDLVQLTWRSMDAPNRGRFDRSQTMFADDAVFDVSAAGVGRFEGEPAIRGYLEDWVGSYEEQSFAEWNGEDLGNGVVFVRASFDARPLGSSRTVRERWAFTVAWEAGSIVSVVADGDVERARAAASELAVSRGRGR
jgi:hypothetical protein